MPQLTEYRRKLPHLQPPDGIFFITFRLKGSLPSHLMKVLSDELKKSLEKYHDDKVKLEQSKSEYYDAIEETLDRNEFGPSFLHETAAAQIVKDSLLFLDGKHYKLLCYCIMGNHVHFIAYKFNKPVNHVMDSLKTFTARKINKALGRTGALWQREYYDRLIRDRNDLSNKVDYVLNNPVKIGLVNQWQQWPWSWKHPAL
jgi:putative transposase